MEKRKIGLILVPEHTNYGAQLQSYAIQQVVEALGCDTEIILYQSDGHRHIKFYWGLIPWYISNFCNRKRVDRYKNLDEIHAENHRLRKDASKAFMSCYLKNFHKCIGYNELVKVGSSYDSVLIGSDQMWPAGVAFGNFVSMRFVPKGVRRISYATSCGVTSYPKYCYKSSADMWRSFEYLSTREKQGKTLIQKVCGKDINVEVLCDPTYLLSKDEWEERMPTKQMLNEKYVLCYLIGNDVEQKKCAKKYAQKLGLKLVSLMSNESVSEIDTTFADVNIMGAGPVDFINWIRGSECFFTDSFHGLAFAVINEKQFYVFYRHKSGTEKTRNSRIDNIIDIWEIRNRLIVEEKRNWDEFEEHSINYELVRTKVAKKRKEGLSYLRRALSFS